MIRATIKSMQFTLAVAGISLLVAGCGGSSTEVRGDGNRLLASGPASGEVTTDGPDPSAEPPASAQAVRPAPHDPADRLAFMERMRLQILHKTRRMPEQRYHQVVRPSLRRQLLAMGLDEREADIVLSDVDRAR